MTYAEWVSALDRLRESEDEEQVLAQLELGSIDWTSGVAERLTTVLQGVTEARLRRGSEMLQRDMARGGSDSEGLAKALLASRRRYEFLLRLANLPALPGYVREHFGKSVRESAAATQKALDESAHRDRTGRLASVIRNNSVMPAPNAPKAMVPPPATPIGMAPRRRVILP